MFSKVDIESLRSTWDEVTQIAARIGPWLTVGAEYQVEEGTSQDYSLFVHSLSESPTPLNIISLDKIFVLYDDMLLNGFIPQNTNSFFDDCSSTGPSLFQ
jgi:hypothetical protein